MTAKNELIAQIERARSSGRRVTVHPPLSIEQMADLETRSGASLPIEIRELIEYAGGFSVDDFAVMFGVDEPFECEGLLPSGIPIATDGVGNFWIVEVGDDGGGLWGPVLFVAHDPPVIIVQAPDVAAFIGEVFTATDPSELPEPYVAEVWRRNPYVIPRSEALASKDDALRSFAQQLSDAFLIADLRNAEVGRGFVWGLAGPNTDVRRHRDRSLLFATEQKRPGLLARMFSR